MAPDGRIHATFNQTVARTGRLSSDQPNLHNIPVRSDVGREFRRAFVPAPGCELLVADYNQIELRCIAHLAAGSRASSRASPPGEDIHTETASRVFGVEPGDVTIEQRSKAKMVSYGLAYGMEAYGLGQRLNIPTEDAAVILDAYFEAFPSVREYMDRTVAEARERGYTETLFGRRRQIPELSSPNFRIRQAGERQAMNAGIQGLAADIFKVALVRIETALEDTGMDSPLILQVHDEVLLDVPPAEHDAAAKLVVEAMSGAVELSVPARGQPVLRQDLGRRQGLTDPLGGHPAVWRRSPPSRQPTDARSVVRRGRWAGVVRARGRGHASVDSASAIGVSPELTSNVRRTARPSVSSDASTAATSSRGTEPRWSRCSATVTRPVPGSSVSDTGRTIVHASSLARSASSASALACRYCAHRSLALRRAGPPRSTTRSRSGRRRRPGRPR